MPIVSLIPVSKALAKMCLSRSTAWRLRQTDPTFPIAVQVGHNRFAFREDEVQRWIDARPRVLKADEPVLATAARAASRKHSASEPAPA